MSENFFLDNKDLQFRLKHANLREIVNLLENFYRQAEFYPGAPKQYDAAMQEYCRALTQLGRICAKSIAPRASGVDREGVTLHDGQVSYAAATADNMRDLGAAGMLGVCLPRMYGGLNYPTTIYVMLTELISRADASLQNIFGLQEIAVTIAKFGDAEQKNRLLPEFVSGTADGAMALTEVEAGSDLQSVQTAAVFDEGSGQWLISGRKRFITNGCAKVMLVLARSEPESQDGRGLSLFLVERSPQVRVTALEDKLGIHGSPTCEVLFDRAPAELIGQRRRGLTRYVMALMNGARLAIAAQAVGIAEASFRCALAYALERRQFGKSLAEIIPISEMLTRMKADIVAGRTLLYETSRYVDLRECYENRSAAEDSAPEDHEKEKRYGRYAAVLTPMAKYFTTEMCNRVCNDGIQCHGGKGYMRDKLAERFFRDARITNIYEGTSQMQVVAAIGGVMQRVLLPLIEELAGLDYRDRGRELADQLHTAWKQTLAAIETVERRNADTRFYDLMARRLVRMQTLVLVAYLMLRDSLAEPARLPVTVRFIDEYLPEIDMHWRSVTSGNHEWLDQTAEILR